MFVNDGSREEELEELERMGSLRRGKGLALAITMMVEEADAQDVVPRLGDGTTGDGQLTNPGGVAFVPAHGRDDGAGRLLHQDQQHLHSTPICQWRGTVQ
jgi:hypothetical protein